MKLKTTLLAASAAALLAISARAEVTLTYAYTVSTSDIENYLGLVGSTFTFEFTSSNTHYDDLSGFAVFQAQTGSLTISGATVAAANGTYAMVPSGTSTYLFAPDLAGNARLAAKSDGGQPLEFAIGPINGFNLDFASLSFAATALQSVLPGDPIEVSDWQGMTVTEDGEMRIIFAEFSDDTFYELTPAGTLGAVVNVPEPSTYAVLAGLVAIGLVVLRRRR